MNPEPQTPERDNAGRFRADASFHQTLDTMATVLRHAAATDGMDPAEVGRVRFDRARQELGLAIASAQGIAKRMRLPFPTLVRMALKPAAERARAAGIDHKNATPEDFPISIVLRAIRAAGYRAGTTPGVLDYDGMVAADNDARERAGLATLGLPHSATVSRQFGGWDRALKAAGFATNAQAAATAARAPEPAELIVDGFLDAHGFIPNSGYLVKWCQLTNTPLGRDAKPHPDLIERVRARRAPEGKWTPDKSLRTADAPPVAELATGSAARPDRTEYTEADAIRSLQLYKADTRRSGTVPTYRGYKAFARGRDGIVSATSLGRLGGFVALSKKAGI